MTRAKLETGVGQIPCPVLQAHCGRTDQFNLQRKIPLC
ncbi:hypothetical protein RR11_1327 [Ruegeria sp. R11]|nr:hypothetical protein RR11_1327 [Ruegeria sp. R11]